MARRGVFGRLPRAAPDLTNTLVALIREANAMEDSNFVDAWKNGGEVDGEGVNDERLLAHMRKRRDALDPTDPAWDQWNNRINQYDFSIAESKMSLKYDQGKVSEQQVSDFYGKWVNRKDITVDSEFYRHLLSQQAKWHEAAKQGRASGGRSSKYEAHNKWVLGVLKDKVDPAMAAGQYILEIAKVYDAAPDTANSLEDVYENTKGWGRVLDIIDDGKSDDPVVQGMIDEATRRIRASKGDNWQWNKASLDALFSEADDGNKSLIRNSMSATEKKQWRKQRADMGYEGARVRATAASARVAQAADNFADDLDDCSGDAYCARAATKKYRDRLLKEVPDLVAGQMGGMTMSTQDTAQVGMLRTTLSQLDDIIAGRKVDTGLSSGAAISGGGTKTAEDMTQLDIMAGAESPGNFLATMGNLWNDDIRKLDSGGWVSSEPSLNRDGSQMVDGEGNPAFHFVTHDKNEVPMPGLVAVKGAVSMMDVTRIDPRGYIPGNLQPHTVRPVQYVTAVPASILTVDEAGNPVTPDQGAVGRRLINGKPDPAGPAQTTPAAGYDTLRGVIGPDGTPRTMYRTGKGTNAEPYLYHTEPPVPLNTKLMTDPKTGAKVPVITTTPLTGPDGKTELVYDIGQFADGITKARKQMKSGNFVLGTYETVGATSTAQGINAIFARNGQLPPTPQQLTDATKLLDSFKTNVASLPDTDPTKFQYNRDLNQLTQTVNLHSGRKMGQSIDDNYGSLNDRTPQQQRYEQELRARGFTAEKYGQDEVSARINLLEQIDTAEGRLTRDKEFRDYLATRAPGKVLPDDMMGAELNQLRQAKSDVANPVISISNIKVPGFEPVMGGQTPEELARQAGISAGLVGVGGAAPQFPKVPVPAPVAPPTPVSAFGPPTPGPTTAAAAAAFTPPKPKPLPKPSPLPKTPGLVAPTEIDSLLEDRRREEERNLHGQLEF